MSELESPEAAYREIVESLVFLSPIVETACYFDPIVAFRDTFGSAI